MPLIIDAYNVLHVVGELAPERAGIDVAELLGLIAASRHARQVTHVVCDGRPRRGAPVGRIGRAMVHYAGPHRTADDLIRRMVQESTHPRTLTVVTSDQAIVREVRKRRCRTIRSEVFLRQLERDLSASQRAARSVGGSGRRPVRLPAIDVRAEIQRFGLGADELASLERQHDTGQRSPRRARAPTSATRSPSPAVPRPSNPIDAELHTFGLGADEVQAMDRLMRGDRRAPGQPRSEAAGAFPSSDPSIPRPRQAGQRGRPSDALLPDDLIEEARRLWRERS